MDPISLSPAIPAESGTDHTTEGEPSLTAAPPPPMLPPPPALDDGVSVAGDPAGPASTIRRRLGGYRRADVDAALDEMAREIEQLRTELARTRAEQGRADEIVEHARRTATAIVAQAHARHAASGVAELVDADGVDTAVPGEAERAEQEAFDRFFAGDVDSKARSWLMAS